MNATIEDNIEIAATAKALREWANEIRREGGVAPYPTSGVDAGLLEKAAALLEKCKNG
jgi:hypothetical protein